MEEQRHGLPDPIHNSRRQSLNVQWPSASEAEDDVHVVREALKVDRAKRSDANLGVVRKWLEQVKFQHLKMDDMRSVIPQLAQVMEFVELPAFEALFKQGDAGDYLYLVLHGEIGMHIQSHRGRRSSTTPLSTVDRLQKDSSDRTSAGLVRAAAAAEELPDVSAASAESKPSQRPQEHGSPSRQASRPQSEGVVAINPMVCLAEQWGKQVVVCRSGSTFGELALMSNGDKRTATAVASCVVELARIHSSDYQRLLKRHAEVQVPHSTLQLVRALRVPPFSPRYTASLATRRRCGKRWRRSARSPPSAASTTASSRSSPTSSLPPREHPIAQTAAQTQPRWVFHISVCLLAPQAAGKVHNHLAGYARRQTALDQGGRGARAVA